MMMFRPLQTLSAVVLALSATVAQAQFLQGDDVVAAEVLPGWRTAQGTHMAAVRLVLAPGWKTYWRAPGEGGIPPQFNFSGSQNVTAAQTHFPIPEVFYASGMRSIGYRSEVVFPLEFTLPDPGRPARITARMDLGVCEDICMPMSLDFSAVLPVDGMRDDRIMAALADQPRQMDRALDCALTPLSDGLRIAASFALPQGLPPQAVAIVEPGDPTIWASDTTSEIQNGRLTATAEFVPPYGRALALDRSAVRVTVLGGGQAIELRGCD